MGGCVAGAVSDGQGDHVRDRGAAGAGQEDGQGPSPFEDAVFARAPFERGVGQCAVGQLLTTLLITTDVAFLGGAYLAKRLPMSRGRTLVIDARRGRLLAGAGIITLIQGEARDATLFYGSAMAGTVLGLASVPWFTRR
jgi:hypothetical protein